jgi:hypothetical protein
VRRALFFAVAAALVALGVIVLGPPLLAGRSTVADPSLGGPLVLSTSLVAADKDADKDSQVLWDSKANTAILAASNIRPGFQTAAGQGQVTIVNLKGSNVVALQEASVTYSCPASRTYPKPAPASPPSGTGCASTSPGYGQGNLPARLRLTVTDLTTARLVFDGLFNATGGAAPGYPSLINAVRVCGLGATAKNPCPTWGHGESHTFSFRLAFPNTVRPAGADNPYQGTRASAAFAWGTL